MKALFLVVAVTAAANMASSLTLTPTFPVSLVGVGSGTYYDDMHQRHSRAYLPQQQLGNKQKPPPSKIALKAGTCGGEHESRKAAEGPGQRALCVSESVYREAITRGQLYEFLDNDDENREFESLGTTDAQDGFLPTASILKKIRYLC